MHFDQLPPVSYEELISGVQREIQYWDLPKECICAFLALTAGPGEKSLAELVSTPLDGSYDPDVLQYKPIALRNSFFYKDISQILKNKVIWVERGVAGEVSDADLEVIPGDGLFPEGVGRYFLFPIPVVASPVTFFLLCPGPEWEGSAEGLCKGVLHLADRLSGLHLATNLLGAFMPKVLSAIPDEQELVSLFASRIAQILLPSQYQINISYQPEPSKWQKYCLNIPSSEEVFKLPLRQRYYLMYHLSTLKTPQAYRASDRGLSKIKARKQHLRVLMERSYNYIYECWQSVTQADLAISQSTQALTQELIQLRTQLEGSADRANALVDRLTIKLDGIRSGNSNAFYRSSYGWMVFFKNQLVELNSDQKVGFTCIHHLLSNPNVPYSIDSMVIHVNNHARRGYKKQKLSTETEKTDIEEIELDKLFSQRGFQFSAEQLWEEVNPMGSEAKLLEALALYEKKGAFSKQEYAEMNPKEKEKVLLRFLHALACQRFILLRLIQRFGEDPYRSQCQEVEKKINQTTFVLTEDSEINPDPNPLEFFEDTRIDFWGDQSVKTVGKSKAERKKSYENITRAIIRAIDNIDSEDLKDYLREHIEIGDPCCYRPGSVKVAWTTEVPV